MMSKRLPTLAVLVLAWLAPLPALAQAPAACTMPPLPSGSKDANIFSPEQAVALGDVVMQQVARQFKLVRDPALDAYVQRIADRLSGFAGTGSVRVELLDLPEVNAFTFPGGRVLMSRKLVAFARNEDEVAGVLAHEFGHVVARDPERILSTTLRRVLGVTSVGDARDIESKYNALVDNQARKPVSVSSKESDEEQEKADALAVWLMARAGYSPNAYAEIWNRYNELQSNTGNWLGDFFGTTKPEAKRLRVAVKAAASFPASCRGVRATTEQQFGEWQRSVVEASRSTRAASLHGVVLEKKIEPPLRSTLSQLRFSPDGRWVLAQDDSSVFVFERAGLAFSFRFDAPDAYPAGFSPDSTAVVFYDTNYRVERWSLASKRREWVHDLVMNAPCRQSEMSPDAAFMACITGDLGLRILDVATGALVFEKEFFYRPTVFDDYQYWLMALSSTNPQFFRLHFTPDAKVLVAARGGYSIAVDLQKRQAFSLPGSIRSRIGASFAFLGPDRLVGVHMDNPDEESAIVTFPQGEVVAKLKLGRHPLRAPTRSDTYVFVDGIAPLAVAFFNLKDNKLSGGSRAVAFDMYDDLYVNELRSGQIVLQKVGDQKPMQVATVPAGPLGRLHAVDVSPDFRVLAASQWSRGLVWDLQTDRQVLLRGFRGAAVDAEHVAVMDFPRDGKIQRAMFAMAPSAQRPEPLLLIEPPRPEGAPPPDPATVADALPISNKITAARLGQYGRFLVGFKDTPKKSDDVVLAVFDAKTGRELWTRTFRRTSDASLAIQAHHKSLILMWNYASAAAKAIAQANPALVRQFEGMKAYKEEVGLLEAVDLESGAVKGDVLVDFGRRSFLAQTAVVRGDYLLIGDNNNRTMVFSMSTGKPLGRTFGSPLDLAVDADRVIVQNGAGEVTIYSVPTLEKVDEFNFSSAVVFARFNPGGTRVFVLTKDQTAYTIEVAPPGAAR
jgi:hypothetical protein